VRTRATLASIFASVSVLVIGWQIGASSVQTSTTATTSTGTSGTGTTGTGTTGATGTAGTTTTTTTKDGTYTGQSESTRFGSVQVQVTIAGGQITDVTALALTDADGRSVQISNRAAPVLQQEVLQSQSASVSNVSGATYTSQAYLASVQSALDQAGF
jgi:uncharacterized protein with FMN-binding domain